MLLLLLPPFHKSSPDHSTYRHNTKPTAVQQYTHSQPTDSKLLLSFPTTPCLRSQPPAKQTVLEISLQITLCLPNPPESRRNQNPGSPCPHTKTLASLTQKSWWLCFLFLRGVWSILLHFLLGWILKFEFLSVSLELKVETRLEKKTKSLLLILYLKADLNESVWR